MTERAALRNRPCVQVGAVDSAHSNGGPVTVAVALHALDRPDGKALAKCSHGCCATRPSRAAGGAALNRLQRVNTVKPNALRSNPQRIAGGDGFHPCNPGTNRDKRNEKQREETANSRRVAAGGHEVPPGAG